MYRSYYSWEEDEANKQGHDDERRHRSDYEHDKYAYDGIDRAYWDGRDDEARAERQREEERMREEEQERERREIERCEMQEEEERQYQDQLNYERELEDRRAHDEAEKRFEMDCATEEYLNEIPIDEQELFTQIQEDNID
jgi:hypothetical protein